jgi:predicted RNase H-like HicB family nuclease
LTGLSSLFPVPCSLLLTNYGFQPRRGLSGGRRIMFLKNYDFDRFTINLYVDEQGDWLAHFQEMPNLSAFGDTPQEALEELKIAWELVKEDCQEKGKNIVPNVSIIEIATG